MLFIKPAFWGVLFFSVASLLGSILTRSQTLIRLFYLGMILIVISLIWTILSLRKINISRSVRGFRQQLGQVLEEKYELSNRSGLPTLWVQIDDKSDLPQTNGSRVLAWIKRREIRSYVSYTLLTHRGLFHLGPTIISSGDPIGLFGAKKNLDPTKALLVLPHLVKLSHFPFPPGILPGGKTLMRKTQEVTPHAAGVREYAPGDSLSRIHWPITARKDKFMVKEFDQDPQADIWILLDCEQSIHCKTIDLSPQKRMDRLWILGQKYQVKLPDETFEYSVSIAASIAQYFIKRGEPVGFASAVQSMMPLPAEKGERQLGKILETLAFVEANGAFPLQGLVDVESRHISRGSTVILISTSKSESVGISIDKLMLRNIHPIVILVDALSFCPEQEAVNFLTPLKMYKTPVIVVEKGDDLKSRLENG